MIAQLQKLAKEVDGVVFAGLLIKPDGSIGEYTRIIDADLYKTLHEEMFKFYTDDLHNAMWNLIKQEKIDE